MVQSRPPRTNENRESKCESLADLEAAYRGAAEDPTVENCIVNVPNRTLSVRLASEVSEEPLGSILRLDTRRAPRAQVCASALVLTKEKPATEHMVYDLSTEGIRLCGLPHAEVGENVRVRLQLPRVRVRASGHVVRCGSTPGSPDFAIQFADVEPRDEDAIQSAVVEAVAHPDRYALLLLQREEERSWPVCFNWLAPLSPICATATTSLEAVGCLEEDRIEIGILGPPGDGAQDFDWNESHPEVCWRSIDHAGRLHPVATLDI